MSALSPIPDAGQVLRVREAGKDLAMALEELMAHWGLEPEMLPAVLLSTLHQAVPTLIEPHQAQDWPESEAARKEKMREMLLQLIYAGGKEL